MFKLCSNRKKQLPRLRSQVQTQVQQVPIHSTSLVEQVQQVPRHSTTSAAQTVLEQVQQESLHPTPSTTQAVQEQVQQTSQDSTPQEANEESEEQGPSTKKKRGRTQMQNVHGRSERKLIVLNKHNQPVGPTQAIVAELGSFLGTLARNSTFCPVNVSNWRKLKTHKDMWKYTKEKYNIPDTAQAWALKAIQSAWRKYKNWLKKKHYVPYANDELRMENRPGYVPQSHFKDLLVYWNSEKSQKMSNTNTENRKKLRYPHTVGKKSFAVIREAEMERIETQESEDGSQSVDAFAAVMGPDHPGHVRLYGRGVTKTVLKGKAGDSGPSLNGTDELMKQKMEEMEVRMQKNAGKIRRTNGGDGTRYYNERHCTTSASKPRLSTLS
ncbi:uncharacterized protein LOC132044454 isoform X1 [Lycium ferocissimum]|uniref:uncharacterized protein LOC132044454 isoform X1 n=1 Tax=Lycium ferocissimum TaxID=112874 RepID=UPI0028155716|nr:uncharacterized protein LOC132044454 isoform X1 [Lycium ferocissimum]XP_059290914.1 uncharacterized protein LOC132044454 isoform X1 [Lycium ferocissimum]XP_059290915.1 uncharacterized protein LOC132044454 isoform X1 [Lycium ferocissimum]